MPLATSLDCIASFPLPQDLSRLQQDLDPAWIEAALQATGTATLRRRRLPAEQVVWLVIGMALFRNRSITDVASSLDIALPTPNGGPTAAPSAVSTARSRLGAEPLAWLFERTAHQWAHASADRDRWRGLALYAIDGTTLRVPDTDENRDCYGYASGGHRGDSGYPVTRLVAAMALRSHLVAGVAFGPYATGEQSYAADLWSAIPDCSLTINDRNFLSAEMLLSLQSAGTGRHWLVPAKCNTKWRRLKRFGAHDELVEMDVSKEARRKNPALPETWSARAIRYQRKGFRPRILLTSLVDPDRYPAVEIVPLYHERWEIELGYGEIKTDMLDATRQPLRSKTPERVRQEIWGILIAYNLIRLEIERIADEAGVAPTRVSFVTAYRQIGLELLCYVFTSPGAIPKRLRQLRADIQRFILPLRRPRPSSPRAVKVKMSSYPKKRRPAAEGPARKRSK